jgi:hypothetical protein
VSSPASALPAEGTGLTAAHPTPGALARALLRNRGGELAMPAVGRHVPTPGTDGTLNGVFCTSAANCWAVGSYDTGGDTELNQALHWNGKKWSKVSTPNPSGTSGNVRNELFAVRCTKATDCWAVGDRQRGNGAQLDQALHWNGKTWSRASLPTPAGTLSGDSNELFDVVCVTSTNCWAAGEYGTTGPSSVTLNQVLHWNGKKWAQVTVPNPGGTAPNDGSAIDAVRCTSATNCWAVGAYGTEGGVTLQVFNEALHWNGKKWSKVSVPNPGGTANGDFSALVGLSCTKASDCWAGGEEGIFSPFTIFNEALHWNGKKWSSAAVPNPGGTSDGDFSALNAVSCTSVSYCWAVGRYGNFNNNTDVTLNEALHWNGKKWSKVSVPNPAGTDPGVTNDLFAIRCTFHANCWSVGMVEASSTGPEHNEALHWNGTKWSAK